MTQFKGDLTGFPSEIVEKMLYYQVEQGGERDVRVFERNRWAKTNEGGFSWENTPEEYGFWFDVITDRDFDLFFEIYPKEIDLNKIESVLVALKASDGHIQMLEQEIKDAHKLLTEMGVPINGIDVNNNVGRGKREELSLMQRIGYLKTKSK